jgi:hypothetical protein
MHKSHHFARMFFNNYLSPYYLTDIIDTMVEMSGSIVSLYSKCSLIFQLSYLNIIYPRRGN